MAAVLPMTSFVIPRAMGSSMFSCRPLSCAIPLLPADLCSTFAAIPSPLWLVPLLALISVSYLPLLDMDIVIIPTTAISPSLI